MPETGGGFRFCNFIKYLCMKQVLIGLISLLILLASLFSCIAEENVLDKKMLPANMKAIELKIQSDGQPFAQSLGGGEEAESADSDPLNENKIENLSVLLFKENGELQRLFGEESLRKTEVTSTSFKLQIFVPLEEASVYQGQVFKVCLVANHIVQLSDITNLSQLKQIVQETEALNEGKPQDKFLMDGMLTTKVAWSEGQSVFTVEEPFALKRAASKIRLRIDNIKIHVGGINYLLQGAPSLKLVNYTNKTSLLQEVPYTVLPAEWKTTEYQVMKPNHLNEPEGSEYWTMPLPYYAYENDWSGDAERETYLLVRLNLYAENNAPKSFYYRIPINYRLPLETMPDKDKEGLHKLQRNHFYEIVSSIEVLGNEDESNPLLIETGVTIEPWIKPEPVDGSVYNAHYLAVEEKEPLMMNVSSRELRYVSDLPVEIKINYVGYELYNEMGEHEHYIIYGEYPTVEYHFINGTNVGGKQGVTPFAGATVELGTDATETKILITHPIPGNYLPFNINFTVTQILPKEDGSKPLSEVVHVTQYPAKFVTGEKSPGFTGGTSSPFADFRYHNSIGSISTSAAGGGQFNEVFYKITTQVSDAGELIGDPTDSRGVTKSDAESNKLISPQFIIASQQGMSLALEQYTGNAVSREWRSMDFARDYGPYSSRYPVIEPYYQFVYQEVQYINTFIGDAANRCYQYFEGDYGMDGDYTEYYVTIDGGYKYVERSRNIKKTFKYKGRWRIPTMAELEYIDRIQTDDNSSVKYLLMGVRYWSAEQGRFYGFNAGYWFDDISEVRRTAYVRCVFDTYKYQD